MVHSMPNLDFAKVLCMSYEILKGQITNGKKINSQQFSS
jgi:hypothetical protein